ncbi:hypothetical protein Tco_1564492, partial [Tanacetum coccineum]
MQAALKENSHRFAFDEILHVSLLACCPIPAVAPVTVGKPRGTTQVVTHDILMIGVINAGGMRYCTRQYE